jgi:hypothetical protein
MDVTRTWRQQQTLTEVDRMSCDTHRGTFEVVTWHLVEKNLFPTTLTLIASTPTEWDARTFTGVPAVSVYAGAAPDTDRCLITVPSLERARLYAARTLMTGQDSFEALSGTDAEAWMEAAARLMASEHLAGRPLPDDLRLRTFILGNPWHIPDGDDCSIACTVRLKFADSLAQAVTHYADAQDIDPLAVGIRSWHNGRPAPAYIALPVTA